ncbi:hypothetical protein QT979_07505 [Microcoleus sp. w2-18bC1]|uniref:hypothetical protein n=1 Tax=unclassified Microcoleus TaxID=2642155 RepID=UPI002FD0C545
MKPKQLKILATALLMVFLGAVVSVTAQNPTTVCGYFSAYCCEEVLGDRALLSHTTKTL